MTVARVLLAWAAVSTALTTMACLPGSKSIGSNDEEAGNDDAGDADDDDDNDSATSAGDGDGDAGPKLDVGGTGGDDDDDDDDDDEKLDVGGGMDGTDGTSECVDPPLCEPCAPDCVEDNECIAGDWFCHCACDDDTGGTGVCDIEETACEVAEQSKTPPIDCGVATLDDDVSVWEDVHQCVLEQASATEAFKGVFYLQGIDSSPRTAFVGQVGFVYATSQLNQDVGGVAGPDSPIVQAQCTGLAFVPDCVVEVGFTCISCLGGGGGEPNIVCEP